MQQLQDLYVYPIKSMAGIRLEASTATQEGLQYDRRWMLVDKANKFLSQREHVVLALFKTAIASEHLIVSHPNHGKIEIPLRTFSAASSQVEIWDDFCSGIHVDSQLDEWFSDILQQEVRLMQMPDKSDRPTDPRYAEGHHVGYADGYPYLLISQASLDDLNSRLEKPLPMNRFRPNIVISGNKAFVEDDIKRLRIGTCEFEVVKPCARCVVTTIDQDNLQKGKEPLKTLSSYRTIDHKVLFGQNLICLKTGMLKVGDEVEILEWKRK